MRLLHTSDWHIGHSLGRNRRHAEHAAFLDWLGGAIDAEGVDGLVIAGDVFDTAAPSARAQELYYRFLCRVAAGRCRHVVVVAGNHDSPAFLDAPRELLRALRIHVVGTAAEDPADEVLVLRGAAGKPELIVCAVPHLRDRDVRESVAGESGDEKNEKLVAGIRDHYAAAFAAAEAKAAEFGGENGEAVRVPVIATGHLFAAGGAAVADDGVRDLHVGSLVHVPADVFPAGLAYVALGHLHAPQIVGGDPARRYSGAPIAMGFGEAGREKSVCIVDINNEEDTQVRTLPVPVFQRLEKIEGDWAFIKSRLAGLAASAAGGEMIWLGIEYTGDELLPDLHARVAALADGTALVPVKIANRALARLALAQNNAEETLDDLTPADVFERRLAAPDVAECDKDELRRAYAEILLTLHESEAACE